MSQIGIVRVKGVGAGDSANGMGCNFKTIWTTEGVEAVCDNIGSDSIEIYSKDQRRFIFYFCRISTPKTEELYHAHEIDSGSNDVGTYVETALFVLHNGKWMLVANSDQIIEPDVLTNFKDKIITYLRKSSVEIEEDKALITQARMTRLAEPNYWVRTYSNPKTGTVILLIEVRDEDGLAKRHRIMVGNNDGFWISAFVPSENYYPLNSRKPWATTSECHAEIKIIPKNIDHKRFFIKKAELTPYT